MKLHSLSGFLTASVVVHATMITAGVVVGSVSSDHKLEAFDSTLSLGVLASRSGQQPAEITPPTKATSVEQIVEPVKPTPARRTADPGLKVIPKVEEKPLEPPEAQELKTDASPPLATDAKPLPTKTVGMEGVDGNLDNEQKSAETGVTSDAGAQSLRTSYDIVVLRHLKKEKRYPALAKRRKREGAVRVSFSIDRSGQLLSSAIENQSVWPELNRAAQKQLHRASPFPAAPDSADWNAREYNVTISFYLEDAKTFKAR